MTEAETFMEGNKRLNPKAFRKALDTLNLSQAEDFKWLITRYTFKDGSFIKVQERRVDIGITP